MADEVTYTAEEGGARSVIVTGADGADHEFVAGRAEQTGKVPASVIKHVREGLEGYKFDFGSGGGTEADAPDAPADKGGSKK